MGLCASHPLQKTTGNKGTHTPEMSPKTASPRHFEKSNSNPAVNNSENQSQETLLDQSAQLPEPPRPYFSFTSFILQNKNPQIFEWLFLQDLGKGSMSQIYLVKNTDTELLCVAKVYNNAVLHRQTLGNEDPPIDCLNREIEIMSSLTHPNVLSFHEMIDDNPTNSTILVLPYASCGNLQSLIIENRLSLDNLLVCAYQIAESISFMHSKNIAHRDIKPDNILAFHESYFCISSFSVSTVLEDENELYTDLRGTPVFWSPEEVSGNPFQLKKADVWAFGVTLFWSIYKKYPFGITESKSKPLNAFALLQIFQSTFLEFPTERTDVPIPVRKLLEQLLEKDPEKRPSFNDIQGLDLFERARFIQKTEIMTANSTPINEAVTAGFSDPTNTQTE